MHPLDIAAQTALLSDLAAGGVYIGLVRGGWLADHGIRELQPPIQALREAIAIIRKTLAGESAGYAGRVYQIAAHARAPYPLPQAKIPLQIGTWGEKLAALAGEVADEVKIGGSANPDVLPVIADYIATGEARAGRPIGAIKLVIGAVSVIDENRELARWVARKSVALYLPIVSRLDPTLAIDPELMARVQAHVNAGARTMPPLGLYRTIFWIASFLPATRSDVISQCEALYDAGAQRIELGTPHGASGKPQPASI